MFDSAEVRVHPTGKAIARFGTKSQGQGHETTYAQIIAEELGLPAAHVQVEEGDTDTAPYGLGTYASRSTPTAGAVGAMAVRAIRDKAAKIAAHLLEVGEEDLGWEPGQFLVKGAPGKSVTIQECAFAAYANVPEGLEPGLEATNYYDPPNLNIIDPMIVEGQIHGGVTQGLGPALYEEIPYDEDGNNLAGSFMDYLVPTAVETPAWETGHTATPSPHHPLGAKGVGESATVGAPPAIANAVVDALAHLGVTHMDIPITPDRVWGVLVGKRGGEVMAWGRGRSARRVERARWPDRGLGEDGLSAAYMEMVMWSKGVRGWRGRSERGAGGGREVVAGCHGERKTHEEGDRGGAAAGGWGEGTPSMPRNLVAAEAYTVWRPQSRRP